MSENLFKENEKLDKELESILAQQEKEQAEFDAFCQKTEEDFEKNVMGPIEQYCENLKKMYAESDANFEKKTGTKADE